MAPVESRVVALVSSAASPALDLVPSTTLRDEANMLEILDALLSAKRSRARKAAQLLDILRVVAHQQEQQLRALQAHVAYRKKLNAAGISVRSPSSRSYVDSLRSSCRLSVACRTSRPYSLSVRQADLASGSRPRLARACGGADRQSGRLTAALA